MFLRKLQVLKAANLLKRDPSTCFPVNIAKSFRTAFSIKTPLVASSGIETFFYFVIHTTLKFMKIVCQKHNLIVVM